MSATPAKTQPPQRFRPVVSFTISKPAVVKFNKLRRRSRAKSGSALLECLIEAAFEKEFRV